MCSPNAEHMPVRPEMILKRCLMMKRILSLLVALMLCCSLALAETLEDYAVATVNGEDLMYTTYAAIESAYLYQYEAAGVDLTDASVYAYLQDLALSYAIEQMLVDQDMKAQGCYDFDEETEAWFAETGKAAYEQALQDVMDAMRTADSTDDELMVYALAYAQSLGVTEQTYVDFYRTQYASENYHQWLIRENPVTDEDVQAAYAARVAESQALYENDVAAFETAVSGGATEVWYTPAGYRNVLQILLPAEGDTAEEKLQSVQSTVEAIAARLAGGETFQALMAEYSTESNFDDESYLASGYQVHQESIVWADEFVAAAFSAEMAAPGCVSQPIASDYGVHILYYLSDAASGPIALTEDLHDMLAYVLYIERYTAAQSQRLTELSDAAEVVFH